MSYCSPIKQTHYKEYKSCFDKPALLRIVAAYNRYYPDNQIVIADLENKQFPFIWKLLRDRLNKICKDRELCWLSHLMIEEDTVIKDYIKPKTPQSWEYNPNEWLSNLNIEAVLIQYEQLNKPFYKFLGVEPSDFLRKSYGTNDECYNRHLCEINIEELYKSGVRTLGLIINLDKHYQSGSHWTSLFVCIDPYMPCYGAYYFDSAAKLNKIPPDIITFMNNLQTQAKKMRTKYLFKKKYNTIRKQFGHTECGIFAIYNQLKWIYETKKRGSTITFKKIVNEKINDDDVFLLRKQLYRPIE